MPAGVLGEGKQNGGKPMFLLGNLFHHLITIGSLHVIDAAGKTHTFKGRDGPEACIRLHERRTARRMFFNPSLGAGEAYTDGTLTVEDGTLYDFMDLIGINIEAMRRRGNRFATHREKRLFRRIRQFNPVTRARLNVAHHYDLSGALYDLFLDTDRQYSCAYFKTGEEDLETAQDLKRRHIADKLLLESGHRVLDIGSGWGGMALHLASGHDAEVTGVTLSTEQLTVAQARAEDSGVADRVEFHLRDYRQQTGIFDRIVSVGMFEHVGITHFHEFFAKVRDLLAEDGVALLHTIGRTDGPGVTDPWIRKYIFPGGYIPALSEVTAKIERAGLMVTDVEVLRLHYAETLRHWRKRFLANRDKVKALYDERFCRMWEFYLVASEIAFRYLETVVFQIQLAKRQDAVPFTRNYMMTPGRGSGRRGQRAA